MSRARSCSSTIRRRSSLRSLVTGWEPGAAPHASAAAIRAALHADHTPERRSLTLPFRSACAARPNAVEDRLGLLNGALREGGPLRGELIHRRADVRPELSGCIRSIAHLP